MARRRRSRNRFNSNRNIVAMKQRRQDKRAAERGEDCDDAWSGLAAHTQVRSAGCSVDLSERNHAR